MARSKRKVQRERKVKQKQKRLSVRYHLKEFPDYNIEPGEAPESFVDAVRDAIRDVRRESESVLSPPALALLRRVRAYGACAAKRAAIRLDDAAEFDIPHWHEAMSGLGEAIFARIPEPLVSSHVPYHMYDVDYGRPDPRRLTVRFRSLKSAPGERGRVYYSRRRPTVRIDGRELVVAFSDHAVHRVCERVAFNWRSFAGASNAFDHLEGCVYYEPLILRDGSPWFAVFGLCFPGYPGGVLAEAVTGAPAPLTCKQYYRVGYCPAVVEGGFLKATTLLLPGMRGTPERGILHTANLSPAEWAAFHGNLEAFMGSERGARKMVEVQGWFHRNGVPQVVRIDRTVFALD